MESIEFIEHTSPGYTQFADQIRAFNPTVVIHCAWDGGNSYADINSPKQVHNISDGVELIDVLRSVDSSPRFVGFGSFAEYGSLTSRAVETMPDSPTTVYGHTKACFKTISKMLCEQSGLQWTWIRPCYIYGSGDVPTRFVPSVLSKLQANEHVLLDSCTSTVDYLHVDDFCSGVDTILGSSVDGVFNVCSGHEYPIRDVITLMQSLTASKSVVTFDETRDRVGPSKYTCGDPGRLVALGWSPLITLDAGLTRIRT
jgi:nucleoside-diphosphate-sugar epimerase